MGIYFKESQLYIHALHKYIFKKKTDAEYRINEIALSHVLTDAIPCTAELRPINLIASVDRQQNVWIGQQYGNRQGQYMILHEYFLPHFNFQIE